VYSSVYCKSALTVFLPAAFLAATGYAVAPSRPLPTLTTADQVRSLSYEDSLRGYPVRIRDAQVLYYNPALGNLYIRNAGHGIYVDMGGAPVLPLHAGDLLDVSGLAGPGGFAPVIDHVRLVVTGRGALPPAPRYSLDHLLTGMEDGQWVEVEGIVRAVEKIKHVSAYANEPASGTSIILITLATGVGRLNVIVAESGGMDPDTLLDSDVIVRGISGPRFNQKRQLIGIQLLTQSLTLFRVVQRGPSDPFSLPVRDLESVMLFTPGEAAEHRIRVRGVVTAIGAGRFFSIADQGHGLFIRAASARDLKVGDLVDVVGFPAMGDYSPVLEDVVYRKIGTGPLPAPIVIRASEIFTGIADSQLVRIQGRLLKQTRTPQTLTLLLTADDHTFSAVLPVEQGGDDMNFLRDGSILELTGTCFVEVFPDQTPRAVQIMLRSSKDVVEVRSAPWWTARHTILTVGILIVAVVIAFVWITRLRRRIRMQLAALQKAREEAAAINDLVRAMKEVTTLRNLTARVSAAGSEQIAQLGIGFNMMLSELEQGDLAKRAAEAKLQHQALTDELTGLPNRRSLSDRLMLSLSIAKRERLILGLLYIDLDGFKLVNDSLGHAVGDLLLIQVAQRLRAGIRQSDTLARLGGDEFTVILTTIRTTKEAEKIAANLLAALSEQFIVEGNKLSIGASIGISLCPQDSVDPMTLLQQADSAMYAAKGSGKNQIRRFTPEIGSSVRERLSLDNQLRGAIGREEIHLHYQPEFEVSSHRLTRFEALARWTHPALGVIPPAKFIPIAEETGQIHTLGAYLLEQACLEAVRWQTISSGPIQVAVNVSSLQFTHDSFVDEVAQILKRTGLNPELLQIELTESIMLIGVERAAGTMKRLRALGVSLAIDDFGTGYSCLSYLPRLPFDTMKIDRSFVHELESRPGAMAIVSFLITLAHSLKMQVVLEGVETRRQLEIITELNGNEVQGFFLGRPTSNPQALLQIGAEKISLSCDLMTAEDEVPASALGAKTTRSELPSTQGKIGV
jgi:diguanylate cyclase (GGDEF)-like protein